MSASAALLFIGMYFYMKHKELSLKRIFILSSLFFILCTLDEQVLEIALFLVVLSFIEVTVLNKCNQKKKLLMWASVVFLYFLYHYTWGRWFFAYFTQTPLLKHPHDFSKVLDLLDNIPGIRSWLIAVKALFWRNKVGVLFFFSLYTWLFFRLKEKKKAFLSVFFLLCSVGMAISLCTFHGAITRLPELPRTMYFIISMILLLLSILLIAEVQEKNRNQILFLCLVITFVNVIHIQLNRKSYALTNAFQGGVPLVRENSISRFLESDVIKQEKISRSYFTGLITNEEELEEYINRGK